MMPRRPLVTLCLLLGLAGEPADGSGARQVLEIEPATGPGGGFDLLWSGKPGRSYFLQRSEALTNWAYLPTVTAGQGLTEEWWLASDGPSLFVRLRFTDIPTADPEAADFDLDGLPTMAELTLHGTDPLEADTDKDGIIKPTPPTGSAKSACSNKTKSPSGATPPPPRNSGPWTPPDHMASPPVN